MRTDLASRKLALGSPLSSAPLLAALLLVAGVVLASPAAAQKGDGPPAGQAQRGTRGVSGPRTVVNVRELAAREALNPPAPRPRRVGRHRPDPVETPPQEAIAALSKLGPPPPAARVPLEVPSPRRSPAPALDFEALADNGTSIPPDTMGTVGPNHLMVALNTQVKVQDRTGSQVGTVFSLDGFWSTNAFDPRLAYDPFNDRWIFAAAANGGQATSALLIGVSETNDPSGNWFKYSIDADSTDVCWFDFPSVGFNKDWIVVTGNVFSVASGCTGPLSVSSIYVFGKVALYAGPPTASFTFFQGTSNTTRAPALTHDDSLSTLYLVRRFNGNSGGFGFLGVSTITGPVATPVLTELQGPSGNPRVRVANTWTNTAPGGGADFCPQMGSPALIQCNDDRVINSLYRNGSLWAAQTVFLPTGAVTRTAAQWIQFQPEVDDANGFASVQQFGRVDDSTGVNFFAFPSIAVNSRNDALLGYSVFSANIFASAAYSFRAASDVPGTMQSSFTYKAGEGIYFKDFGGGENRWGDYSNTLVDPVNDLDFWTIQEYAETPSPGSLWGTWWAKVNAPAGAKKRRGQIITQPLLLFLLW